jgi:hypothetical protein
MWSHYSNFHSGAVLELACVPERDSVWGAAMPVKYGDMKPAFDADFLVRLGSGQTSMDPHELIRMFVTAKAMDWRYEHEWRIVRHLTNPNQPKLELPFHPEELAAVYLGCRMLNEHKEEIADIVSQNYPLTKIFAAEKMERKFALRFRDY